MATRVLTPAMFVAVGERFRALGEPARLRILHSLRAGEATVTELVQETDLSQANVSKHLRLLLILGFVRRRKDGLFAYYRLADRDVVRLCDLMCGRLKGRVKAERRRLAS